MPEKNALDNETFNPLQYPEIKELLNELYDKLLSESGRGAVLIGTSYVDDHLTKFISSLLPNKEKNYQNRLLIYPGPLSSFSSKIELCYAFRYISEPVYNSLNALRKIRNDAAHGSNEFSFAQVRIMFNKIFSFIGNYPSFVRDRATEMMVGMKLETLKLVFEEHNLNAEEKAEQAKKLLENKEMLKDWEENQLPHWELIIGLSLLCGMISHGREQILQKIGNGNTWS